MRAKKIFSTAPFYYSPSEVVPSTLLDGLIAYYKLDGNANDSSPNAYNGTPTDITFDFANGKIYEGAGANGSSSTIETADITEFHGATSFTVDCWLNFSTIRDQFILGKWEYLSQGTFGLRGIAGGELQFFICAALDDPGSNAVQTSGLNLTTGTWYYVTIVYDGSLTGGTNRAKVYVDGVLAFTTEIGTIPASLTSGTAGFQMGSIGWGSQLAHVNIDECGIWDRPLTADERAERYNNGNGSQLFFLNREYKITMLQNPIPDMGLSDSVECVCIGDAIAAFGGYDPDEPLDASNGWWYSPNGGTDFARGVNDIPFRVAHAALLHKNIAGTDYVYVFGVDPDDNKPKSARVNLTTGTWTTISSDLTAALSGYAFIQWCFAWNGEIRIAVTNDNIVTKIFGSSDFSTFTEVGAFPANYAFNSCAWTDESTEVIAGLGCFYNSATNEMSGFVGSLYRSTDGGATWSHYLTLPAEFQSAWGRVFKYDSNLFIMPGRNTEVVINEGAIYKHVSGSTWVDTYITWFLGRHAVGVCNHNDTIHFTAGYLSRDSSIIQPI